MAVRMKLTSDEVTQIRAMLREGVHTTRGAIAEQLGYRADTFRKLVSRQQDARESFQEFSEPATPYCALAKTKPKPRSSKAGRPLKEIPEERYPDVEYWAAQGHGKRWICDEMRIPLKVFNAQAQADDRLIEALELGRARRRHLYQTRLFANGNDGGLKYLLDEDGGTRAVSSVFNDNRLQVLHINIPDAMSRDDFMELIEHD